jgi:hypothetical protein
MNVDYSIISFIGLSLIAISICVPIYLKIKKSKNGGHLNSGSHNDQISGDNNNVTRIGEINHFHTETSEHKSYNIQKKDIAVDDIKHNVSVLFIDDKEFPVVEHLKSIGYMRVSYIADVKDLDDPIIRNAHIIFIDINGVGLQMNFPNQGMGLCGAIKKKYGNTKRVILYSGETDGNIFDEDAKKADATLKKDSDVYQFTSYITDYAKELL